MEAVLQTVVLGRAARNMANIKNRQPIGTMYVKADKELPDFYRAIIADELNVKSVIYSQDVRDFTTYTFKPQLKTLGRRFGKQLGALKEVLAGLDGNRAMDEIHEKGTLTIVLDGKEEVLETEDLLIDAAQVAGFVSESYGGVTVVLDTALSEELIEEGFVYEIISKIQTMRKEAGFEVMDHILVSVEGNENIAGIVKKNADSIQTKVLADQILYDRGAANRKEWNINGENVTVGVEKQ